jgi:large subunit ribosomal protein L4
VKNRADINRTGKKSVAQKGSAARATARCAPTCSAAAAVRSVRIRAAMRSTCRRRCGRSRCATRSPPRRRTAASWWSTRSSAGEAKTKALSAQFEKLGLANALIIGGDTIEENFGRAARNIPNIDVLPVQGINVYDILRRQKLVLTKAAVEALEARFK